jgi:hypothetical protein
VTVTVPLPEPDAPAVIESHVSLLAAVHVQPIGALTATSLLPPAAATVCAPGEIVSVHGTPSCVALKVLPAIVIVPLRGVMPGLAAAFNVTLPLPDPLEPAVIVIHEALLVAPQLHPAGAVTATVLDSPAGAKAFEPGAIVSVQLMPACVALKVCPAIVIVADREEVLVFAAALSVTVPLPEPEPPLTVIQDGLFVVDHVHPVGAVTVTLALPPSVANAFEFDEIVSLQVMPG